MYMIDYLENICAFRLKKQRQTEKDEIRVIASEGSPKSVFQTAPQTEEESVPELQTEQKKLSINIEGEPRDVGKGEAARQAVRRTVKEKSEEEEKPALREEAIRQILEEFLA